MEAGHPKVSVLASLTALVLVGCSASHTLRAVQDGAVDQVAEPDDSGTVGSLDGGDDRGDGSPVAHGMDAPVVPLDPSSPCYSSPNGSCGGIPSYVEISGDGEPILLAYPMNSTCGTCGDSGCELVGLWYFCCTWSGPSFAACAGPGAGGPCLDTYEAWSGKYLDRSGKTWAATLESPSPGPPGFLGLVDLDTNLTISDGSTVRTLVLHIHLCGASFELCGIVC
jgi:hypothetical protein